MPCQLFHVDIKILPTIIIIVKNFGRSVPSFTSVPAFVHSIILCIHGRCTIMIILTCIYRCGRCVDCNNWRVCVHSVNLRDKSMNSLTPISLDFNNFTNNRIKSRIEAFFCFSRQVVNLIPCDGHISTLWLLSSTIAQCLADCQSASLSL